MAPQTDVANDIDKVKRRRHLPCQQGAQCARLQLHHACARVQRNAPLFESLVKVVDGFGGKATRLCVCLPALLHGQRNARLGPGLRELGSSFYAG